MASLFSGIGAFEKALEELGIEYEVVFYSEIDKFAVQSYEALHGLVENKGDVSKIDLKTLPKDIDLLTHGSPCQDISKGGKEKGLEKGSGTRSSLIWNSVDIIREIRPRVVIFENVENILSVKHSKNFDLYLETMGNMGYNNTFKVLNARDFGVPQHRRRLICVSMLDDSYLFPYHTPNMVQLNTILGEYSEKCVIKREMKPLTPKGTNGIYAIGQTSVNGSQGGKVYSVDGVFPTFCAGTHGYASGYILDNEVVRRVTGLEAFKLMGFSEIDYNKCVNIGISETQIYKQAGNSIVVPMLKYVLESLYKK